jgi:hypothetical protein
MIAKIALSVVLSLALVPAHAQGNGDRVRLFAALPNWSGLWETQLSAASDDLSGYSADIGSPTAQRYSKYFKLLGKPPYKPEWEAAHAAAIKPAIAPAGSTRKQCGNVSFPALLELPAMFQVLVTPEETVFLDEFGDARHIYTDGRKHPRKQDLWPTPKGDSIGHWQGATLIIDTIEVTPGPVMPIPEAADLSSEAHFIERVRLVDSNVMQDDVTVDDPLRFARPWQISIQWSRVRDQDRMLPYNCAENDRNPVVDGKLTIAPPKP